MNYPVCILDLETTGVDKKEDRIVEICVIKISSENEREEKVMRLNPEVEIPASASEVHGITNEAVKDCHTFKQIAKSFLAFIEGCDIIGFNSTSFDVPVLYYEFLRAGIKWEWYKVNLIDACSIFKRNEERTLSAAVQFYLGVEHSGAHGALSDAKATFLVFQQQQKKYEQLQGKTNAELSLYSNYDKEMLDIDNCFSKNEQGEIIFNFGKHKGKVAKEMRPYLEWMAESTFSPDTKRIVHKILWNK